MLALDLSSRLGSNDTISHLRQAIFNDIHIPKQLLQWLPFQNRAVCTLESGT